MKKSEIVRPAAFAGALLITLAGVTMREPVQLSLDFDSPLTLEDIPPAELETATQEEVVDVSPPEHLNSITTIGVALAAIVLVAFLAVGGRKLKQFFGSQRIQDEIEEDFIEEVSEGALAEVLIPKVITALDGGLEELRLGGDARNAIVGLWARLESAIETTGFERHLADTPTEFTMRVLQELPVDSHSLAQLLRLYHAARFADAIVSDEDVALASTCVSQLSADLKGVWLARSSEKEALHGGHEVTL